MKKQLDIESLAKLLGQAAEAYDHDGPEYLAERILQWTRELRARCDDVELMLTDYEEWKRKAESERDTGEVEAIV
jgi:hypothetical protein